MFYEKCFVHFDVKNRLVMFDPVINGHTEFSSTTKTFDLFKI